MPKRERFFHPFDVTYSEVSRQVRHLHQTLTDPIEKQWVKDLICNFQIEADKWDSKTDLVVYRRLTYELRLKILQLGAAAYLHISYDLPRVLASQWPGSGPSGLIPLSRVEKIYNEIGSYFPDVIDDIQIMPEVAGVSRVPLRWQAAKSVMRLWVGRLRDGAWKHAEKLQQMPPLQRSTVERMMLDEITNALQEVSFTYPWTLLDLAPPDAAFRNESGPVIYLASAPILAHEFTNGEISLMISILSLIMSLFLTLTIAFRSKIMMDKSKISKDDAVFDDGPDLFLADKEAAKFLDAFGRIIDERLTKLFANIKPA